MRSNVWGVLLATIASGLVACASPPPPAPAVSPPPPEEGPGVLESMVSAARDGGTREQLTSGEGLLEGMVAGSREAGTSRTALDAGRRD